MSVIVIEAKRQEMINGYVVWSGESLIDKEEVMLVITGVNIPSTNRKTGWMIQSWILTKDHPVEAIKTGKDYSICGDCALRGKEGKGRVCYVMPLSISQVYQKYLKGGYPPLDKNTEKRMRGRDLRIGSYGDPTAIPYEVWEPLIKNSRVTTGYTHRWLVCDPRWKTRVHASVESIADQKLASSLGWCTYRIKKPSQPMLADEIYCPAEEPNNKYLITCQRCGKCNGKSGNIAVDVHGMGSSNF